MTISVFVSQVAALRLVIISFIVLIVPFLRTEVRIGLEGGYSGGGEVGYILKLPPTKNWRGILAVLVDVNGVFVDSLEDLFKSMA